MSEKEFTEIQPDFGVGLVLIEELKECGALSAFDFALMESDQLFENAKNTPTSYQHKGVLISWSTFERVYTDYDTYPTVESVWNGLGFRRELFDKDGKKTEQNMDAQLRRLANHFMEKNKDAKHIVTLGRREEAYSSHSKNRIKDEVEEDAVWPPQPKREDIYPGKKGRKTQSSAILARINSNELLPGEFYSDFSRIRPSVWGSWLRFWDREVAPVKSDKSFLGRPWRKTFVLGYQVAQSLVYEIWYNSLDSTFTVHDSKGNPLSRRFPVLNEAVKAMMAAISQASTADSDFFANGIKNSVAQSLFRSMTDTVDRHVEDMKRLEIKDQKEEIAKLRAANIAKIRKDRDDAIAAKLAQEERRRNIEYFKKDLETAGKNIASAAAKATKAAASMTVKFGVPAADAAFTKLKSGAVSLEDFAKLTAMSLGVVGSPMEKELRSALVNDEISLGDYVAAIKTLAEKARKGYKDSGSVEPEEPTFERPVKTGYGTDTRADHYTFGGENVSQSVASSFSKNSQNRFFNNEKKPAGANYEKRRSYGSFAEKRANALRKGASRLATPITEGVDEEWAYGVEPAESDDALMRLTFESLLDNAMYYDVQEDIMSDVMRDRSRINDINQIRRVAQTGKITQSSIKNIVNSELISSYTETRVEQNFPRSKFPRWMNSGRTDPIVLPTDKPGIIDRAKMAIRGVRYQADFVVGFSLQDRVNIEIWYVTEPNPERALSSFTDAEAASKQTVSSFYVFDVTSGRLIRKFVPYLRNAVQVAMAKLSTV